MAVVVVVVVIGGVFPSRSFLVRAEFCCLHGTSQNVNHELPVFVRNPLTKVILLVPYLCCLRQWSFLDLSHVLQKPCARPLRSPY